jgi:hypothetical protein
MRRLARIQLAAAIAAAVAIGRDHQMEPRNDYAWLDDGDCATSLTSNTAEPLHESRQVRRRKQALARKSLRPKPFNSRDDLYTYSAPIRF